jgi:hypothetical protein
MKRSRVRRWLRRALLAFLAAVPFVFVAGWLAVHYVPSWYQPVTVADDDLQRVRKGLTDAFGSVSDQMVAGAPFTVTLSDRDVSEWLVARAEIWPEAGSWIPEWLRGPVVAFVPGRIILAAYFQRDGWEAIVGLHLSAETVNQRVTLKLESITVGALPVPIGTLASSLNSLIRGNRFDVNAMPDELAALVRKLRETNHLEKLTEGLTLDQTLIWQNGDRPYRIEDVQITHGEMAVEIKPL